MLGLVGSRLSIYQIFKCQVGNIEKCDKGVLRIDTHYLLVKIDCFCHLRLLLDFILLNFIFVGLVL